MEFVNLVCQYTTIIEHWPDILCAIVSICYEEPRKEITFCASEYLIYNFKTYNRIKL